MVKSAVYGILVAAILLMGPSDALAQKNTFTGNITFNKLIATKSTRNVSWTNPDLSNESLQLQVIPIPAYANIRKHTRDFARENYRWDDLWIAPRMIVLHAMDFGTLKEALEKSSFLHDRMPAEWGSMSKAGLLSNGAHFIVDRDGQVYCLMPPLKNEWMNERWSRDGHRWMIKRHLEGNPTALGIENITAANQQYTDLTEEQIIANAKLVRWLLWFEQGALHYVTSHHQFNDSSFTQSMLTKFELTYWNKHYTVTDREDIGEASLKEIIAHVAAAGWKIKSTFD